MHPISLCLVQMGNKGLELVKSHPNVLPSTLLRELSYKSMPMGAKPGEFSTASIGEYYYSSYVFNISQEGERDNIGALIAVFSSMNYNIEGIKKIFSLIIKELSAKSLLKLEIIEEILPNLYKGFENDHIKIKVSSVATIELDFRSEVPEPKDKTNGLEEDLW